MHTVYSKISKYATIVSRQYYQLILIVGRDAQINTQLLQIFASIYQTTSINFTIEYAKKVNTSDCSINDVMAEIATTQINTPLLFDAIDVLFDKQVNNTNDPYILLRSFSRHRIVISTWLGQYENQSITYAIPGHSEYYVYNDVDSIVIDANELI